MKRVDFHGIECVELANDRLSLLASISVGPRILHCATPTGENLFAVLPEDTLECPGAGEFHFYGGHRLWAAPEDPRTTYLPDDRAVRLEPLEDGLRLTDSPLASSPLRKTLEIRLTPGCARAVVRHTLTNQGAASLRLAPWAITQFAPGGVAILPQYGAGPNDSPVLPNRRIAIWPYTDLGSEAIRWRDQAILVHAGLRQGKLKLGYPNPAVGWVTGGETLVVKRADYHPGADYFDLGSSSRCYCDHAFSSSKLSGPPCSWSRGAASSTPRCGPSMRMSAGPMIWRRSSRPRMVRPMDYWLGLTYRHGDQGRADRGGGRVVGAAAYDACETPTRCGASKIPTCGGRDLQERRRRARLSQRLRDGRRASV
jgi:hypothetical protein